MSPDTSVLAPPARRMASLPGAWAAARTAFAALGDERRSLLLMTVFVLLWAVIEALAGAGLRNYSPYQIVWARYSAHLALMLLVWLPRGPRSLWRTRRPAFQIGRSLLMLVMPVSWILGHQLGLAGRTLMTIFWLSPFLILGFAALAGERARPAVWMATVVGCTGAVLLYRPGAVRAWPLLVFPVAMAVSYSLYVVMTRSLRDEPTRVNLFYTALGVWLALTPAMPKLWVTPTLRDLAVLTSVGVIGFFELLVLDRMARAAPVSLAAPVSYLELVFMTFIAWGLGDEEPGRRAVVALLLIGGSALYV